MKSGPTLNGWTLRPRRARAAMLPTDTEVFPTPLCVPAIMTARLVICVLAPPRTSSCAPPGVNPGSALKESVRCGRHHGPLGPRHRSAAEAQARSDRPAQSRVAQGLHVLPVECVLANDASLATPR